MISRRGFVGSVGGVALAWPRRLDRLGQLGQVAGAPDDEAFWDVVREGFLIPDDRIYLNNGTLGAPPAVVVAAVQEHERRVAETFPPRLSWEDLKEGLAVLLDGDADGFVFPRNTTEAMSFVSLGLDLRRGDEIVTTDHEHIGGLMPWRSIAQRRGLEVVVASLPVPAETSEALLEAVWERVTPRTRVVSVSHVTFTNGTRFPVEALAQRCREAGIVSVIDGAHPPGMTEVSLRGIGADFYASSPHKWLLAPRGTGLLYLAEKWRTELWPTVASGGWDDRSLGAHRLNHMGTLDESRLAGLLAATQFHRSVRADRVAARVEYLGQRLLAGLRQISGSQVFSPESVQLRAGMVSFSLDGVSSLDLQRHLAQTANARTRVIGEYDLGWMRVSTHVYNAPSHVDRVLEVLHQVSRDGLS